ncbi:uncharacterized protein METZ01_LOCUS268621 [marine metagenome]|uniref:Uncharacterized protein n=1 Tax=marine metagenome TaxID=408172 RepID=A0A382JXT3_9ZZZZ
MIILCLTTFCKNFFINIFVTSIGLVCKNGGVRVMKGVSKL